MDKNKEIEKSIKNMETKIDEFTVKIEKMAKTLDQMQWKHEKLVLVALVGMLEERKRVIRENIDLFMDEKHDEA